MPTEKRPGGSSSSRSSSPPSEKSPASLQISPLVALAIGVVLGLAIFSMVDIMSSDPAPIGLVDLDEDGVQDSHDLEPEGNARIRFTLVSLAHQNLSENTSFNLTIWYDGNGDPSGNADGQSCTLLFTGAVNTSISRPSQGCTFETSDWTMLSVGFGYQLTSSQVGDGNITLIHHWDIFPGNSTDTSGYNSSVDPWKLHQGLTIVLDGMGDGDDNPRNAMLTLVAAADDN